MNPQLATKLASDKLPRTAPAARSVVLGMVGSGGDGVALLGDLVLRMAARQGLYGIMVQSYGPQIRGGESAVSLRISDQEVQYEGDQTDVLLCFRLRDIQRFHGTMRLHANSVVILDQQEAGEMPEWLGHSDPETCRFPFARFENGVEVAGPPKNMLGLGLVCRVLGWPESVARDVLKERFPKMTERQMQNLEALGEGLAATGLPSSTARHEKVMSNERAGESRESFMRAIKAGFASDDNLQGG